jgi:raffinose/stachyose/melibiose transport system substrate-binding protein
MKKFLSLFAVFAILSTVLLSSVSAQDKVTIRWWHIFTTPDTWPAYMQKVADDYMAMHPNVTIEITQLANEDFKQKITTVMQAGDPPDLFQSWGGGVLWEFAKAGLLRDISPDLDANSGEWRNSFSAQGALNLFSLDDKYYGAPWNFGGVGIWYNKDLFAQAGITETPKTWDEFLAVVQQLKDAGITPISLGEKEKWPGHFWWVYLNIRNGGQAAFEAAYNRTGSFTDEPFIKSGEQLKALIDMNPFPEGYLGLGYGQQAGLMGDGKAAMELMGHWAPGAQAGNAADKVGLGDKLGFFPFPSTGGAGDPSDLLGGGDGIAVGKNAPDETIDFLKYLTSEDVQKGHTEIGAGVLPTVAGAEAAVTDPNLQVVLAARNDAKYYQSYYDQFLPPAVGEAVNDAVETLFAGTATPQEVAQAIEDVAAFELEQ